MNSWQPSASISTLKQRALILAKIRQFFATRNVMEVETPLLARAGVTDLYLENLTTEFIGPGFAKGLPLYLQTSPEYAMKRLLAAGSGCIYQICKAMRNDEAGKNHNPEFTMLEWYRVGFDHHQLMAEVDTLLQLILNCQPAEQFSYQTIFQQLTQLDPLDVSISQLRDFLAQQNESEIAQQLSRKDDLLQYIFTFYVEPNIGQHAPCFVYDFPASQASLAKISQQDKRVAHRFEVYFKGIELANGFNELTDANEQAKRFARDNQLRNQQGLVSKPIDQSLIAALTSGLPACSGVAIGIDRLIMLATKKDKIQQVISFNIDNC